MKFLGDIQVEGNIDLSQSLNGKSIVVEDIQLESGESLRSVRIVYDVATMTNYNYSEELVCYLGDDTTQYKHGSFWERVVVTDESEQRIILRHVECDIDLSPYFLKAGGEISGTIGSQDIIPNLDNTYKLGSTERKYNEVNANTINVETIHTDNILTSASTQTLSNNDSIVVATNGEIMASPLVFNGDEYKYLNQAGEFSIPQTVIKEVSDLNDVPSQQTGMIVRYIGADDRYYKSGNAYIYTKLNDSLQIRFGSSFNFEYLYNNGVVLRNLLNRTNELISKIEEVIGQNILDYLLSNDKISISYNINTAIYVIKNFEQSAFQLSQDILSIVNSIVTNNNEVYYINTLLQTESEVLIEICSSAFVLNDNISFPCDKSKYLNGRNEWVSLKSYTLNVNVSYRIGEYNDLQIDGIDEITEIGEYLLISQLGVVLGTMNVYNVNNYEYGQQVFVTNNLYNEGRLKSMLRTKTSGSDWGEWEYEYQLVDSYHIIKNEKGKLHAPTLADLQDIFSNNNNSNLYLVTISGVKGYLLTDNTTLKQKLVLPSSSDFSVNLMDISYFENFMNNGTTTFFPVTRVRSGETLQPESDIVMYYGCGCMMIFQYGSPYKNAVNIMPISSEVSYIGCPVRLVRDVQIGSDVKKYFVSSNLQYNVQLEKFRLAKSCLDCVGVSNINTKGWIDLFGYGTSGYNGLLPTETSTDPSVYDVDMVRDSNYDWGVYNDIYEINQSTNNNDIFS